MAVERKRKKAAASPGPQLRASLPPYWWAWSLVLLIFVGGAILHVHARLAEVRLGYRLSESAQINRKLMAERRKLQVEVATLRSPQRLRRLAKEKLGLMEPTAEQILRPRMKVSGKLALMRKGP